MLNVYLNLILQPNFNPASSPSPVLVSSAPILFQPVAELVVDAARILPLYPQPPASTRYMIDDTSYMIQKEGKRGTERERERKKKTEREGKLERKAGEP